MGSEEYYNMMMIKGKRSKRQRQLLAASSSALALTMAASSSSTSSSDQQFNNNINCVMNCNDDKNTTQVEQDMANCLILLAQGGQSSQNLPTTTIKDLSMYQCKTCDRSFPSFQALGGHRASHKRPKPGSTTDPALINHHESSSSMFNHDTNNIYTTNTTLSLQISPSCRPDSCSSLKISNTKSSSKVHECSICGAEFTSGQALGGHMRRHRSSLLPRASPPHHESDNEPKKPAAAANVFSLDLNLPAPEDMDQPIESKFPAFAMNEQAVIVFSPSALVDCHL